MAPSLAELLPLAAGAALSPVQVITVVALLTSDRPRARAIAFVVGWLAAMCAVGALVLVLPGLHSARGEPSMFAAVLRLVLGVLALATAARAWRTRPRERTEIEMPAWMTRVKGLGNVRAALLGAVQVANPKVLLLVVAGVAAVAQASPPTGWAVALSFAFVLLASSTVIAPVVGFLAAESWTRRRLASVERWLIESGAILTAAILGLLGLSLIGKGGDMLDALRGPVEATLALVRAGL